jgi:hypothetical protein
MHATATFQLDVDVPFPLNMTPKPAIEATATVAVQRTLTSLMDTLCASIVRDHISWTKAKRTEVGAGEAGRGGQAVGEGSERITGARKAAGVGRAAMSV